MGYKRKVYVLEWPAGHEFHGLEVEAKGLPVKKLFELTSLAGQLQDDAADVAAKVGLAEELFAGFAERLVGWNLEEDDGTPVPPDLTGMADQDFDFMMGLVMAWMDAVASVDIPLPQPSPPGGTSETGPDMAALIPVETLSSSQLS
jgi:hypothetical protein